MTLSGRPTAWQPTLWTPACRHVLWWSESQVDNLEGSNAYDDAVGLRDEVALASKVIKSLVGASVREAYKARGEPLWNVWKADDDIDKAVRGAFVSILTRAFAQEEDADEETRLVPLLDMLQHDANHNVRHGAQTDPEDGTQRVVVTARRRIEMGEELLNNYDNGCEAHTTIPYHRWHGTLSRRHPLLPAWVMQTRPPHATTDRLPAHPHIAFESHP